MKKLVLALGIIILALLLFLFVGLKGQPVAEKPGPADLKPSDEKPSTPAAPLSGEKDADYKPMVPPAPYPDNGKDQISPNPQGLPAAPASQPPMNGTAGLSGLGIANGTVVYLLNGSVNQSDIPELELRYGIKVRIRQNGSQFPYLEMKDGVIAGICLQKTVDVYCNNLNDTIYQIFEEDGIPRGWGYEEMYIGNIYEPGNSRYPNPISCTLQYKVWPYGGDEEQDSDYSQAFSTTLGPGEFSGPYRSQNYRYNEEYIDDILNGTTWITECVPYP